MRSGSERLTLEQQADIGRVVRAMRADGVPWKLIATELGFERSWLWRLAQARRGVPHCKQQKTSSKQHLSGSQNARAE
jgi:DNA invertase Pin-like site-specific DNA recombinase